MTSEAPAGSADRRAMAAGALLGVGLRPNRRRVSVVRQASNCGYPGQHLPGVLVGDVGAVLVSVLPALGDQVLVADRREVDVVVCAWQSRALTIQSS